MNMNPTILLLAALNSMPLAPLQAAEKFNIVYLIADQWRASATGYAGDPNVKTPNLDRLAIESQNFCNAVSVLPVCTPHRASLMTGRYPTSTVGDLLGTLAETGLDSNTIVVFSSDHGEMLGSQGVSPTQKQVAWREAISGSISRFKLAATPMFVIL